MSDNRKKIIWFLKIIQQIRKLLLNKISKDFLIFLLFIFIASFFWILQTLNDNYEAEISIPLKIQNVPSNAIITSEIPKDIKVTLRDKGTVLVNYFMGNKISPVVINFQKLYTGNNDIEIPTNTFQKELLAQLGQSTKLLSIKPDTIDFIYTLGRAKKVPVVLNGNVSAAQQYYISNIVNTPDSVNVYAPSLILDSIKAAYTAPVYMQDISETSDILVDIQKIKGVKFVPSRINSTLYVDIYTEKSMEVTVRGVNFPLGKTLRAFPSKVKVDFQVGLNKVKSVTADDFILTVDYNDLVGKESDKCAVKLESFPSYVKHVKINPVSIDYLIEE